MKQRFRRLLKKVHTPVTIMLIPHSRSSARSIKVPFAVMAVVFSLSCLGVVYTASLTVQAAHYYRMQRRMVYLNQQFSEMEETMTSLKHSESQFRQLFSLGSKKAVLTNLDPQEGGSIDVEELKRQIRLSMDAVKEINRYLSTEHGIFRATPRGWPADGPITSGFGMRIHPVYGVEKFHTGIDIAIPPGTPLHVTADGVVSFAGWSHGSGNVVVVEHGHGFSTVYAHNSRILVKTGQRVKRGDIVSYSGSTGTSTGPHVHYEVWKNGRSIDPERFLHS